MPGRIDWDITFIPSQGEIYAEVYDGNGGIVASKPISCKPPVNCPLSITDLPFAKYKVGLVSGGAHYYYIQGYGVIAAPNQVSQATQIELNEGNDRVEIDIYIDLS
jgi:hypothetical protein